MTSIYRRALGALGHRLRVAGLLVAAAVILPVTLLLGSGAASATPATQPPGSTPSGTVVVVQGTDGALWAKANVGFLGLDYNNIAPNQWFSLGGRMIGSPDVINVNNEPWYVVTGTDGDIWMRTLNTGWNRVAPGVDCVSSPGAAYDYNTGVLYVGCEGTDSALWVMGVSLSANSLGFPLLSATSYGGVISNGPAVAYTGGGLNFLAPTSGGQVWYHGPSVTSPWIGTNANCMGSAHLAADSSPISGSVPGGACTGPDSQAWASAFPAAPFLIPFSVAQGGALLGGPGYADYSIDSGTGVVFAEGTDHSVWYHFQTQFLGDTNNPTYLWYGLGGVVAANTGANAAAFQFPIA